MKALFTLTSSESKRLIAKGIKGMSSIQNAMEKHTVIVAGGTTNAFVAEELLGIQLEDKTSYTMGIVTGGELGVSKSSKKYLPMLFLTGSLKKFLGKIAYLNCKEETFLSKVVMP